MLNEAGWHVLITLLYQGLKHLPGVPEAIVSEVHDAAIASKMQWKNILSAEKAIIRELSAR